MNSTQTIERLLTPQEVADLIQIPVSTLAQWRARRTGPKATVMPGSRLVRYSPTEIQKWLGTAEAA